MLLYYCRTVEGQNTISCYNLQLIGRFKCLITFAYYRLDIFLEIISIVSYELR